MIRCIAIDDEPLALRQVVSYIEKTPFLSCQTHFDSALQALDYLKEQEVDLMFVDINMPDLNGLEFVRVLENGPKVIFTTAHSEYAVQGFKVDAIDYLLKPISYEDFLRAARKAHDRLKQTVPSGESIDQVSDFLFIKSEYKIIRLKTTNIKYVESMREYVRIHLVNQKPVMSLISMKQMEQHLAEKNFMRVHRSYLVNLDHVSIIERNRIVFDGNVYIPVSDQYKDKFQDYLNRNFLS